MRLVFLVVLFTFTSNVGFCKPPLPVNSAENTVGGQELSTIQIQKVLSILHMAFERPAIVQSLSDREPKTTLFILHSLQGVTQDDQLKAQIEEERKFILSQFANAPKQ
jgi:hypothetical protein